MCSLKRIQILLKMLNGRRAPFLRISNDGSGGIMEKVKVLDKNLKIVCPGARCRFRDLTVRKRNGEQIRMIVQGDTACVESVAPGLITLKVDRPVLTSINGLEIVEEDQLFKIKTKYIERFKAWVVVQNRDGVELFLELLE